MTDRLKAAVAERKKLNAKILRRLRTIDRVQAEIANLERELWTVHDFIYQQRKAIKQLNALGQIPKFRQPRS